MFSVDRTPFKAFIVKHYQECIQRTSFLQLHSAEVSFYYSDVELKRKVTVADFGCGVV